VALLSGAKTVFEMAAKSPLFERGASDGCREEPIGRWARSPADSRQARLQVGATRPN